MGRTNGKLIPFLQDGLMYKKYINLVLEESGDAFYVELPRYQTGMNLEYHKLLKDWYKANNHTFESYSNAKSVLKAALKKSVYLKSLPSHGKILRYQFANATEVAENRKRQKQKSGILSKNSSILLDSHSDESDFDQTVPDDKKILFTDIIMNFDTTLHSNSESSEKDSMGIICEDITNNTLHPNEQACDKNILLDFQTDADFDISNFNWKEFCNDIQLPSFQLNDQSYDFLDFDIEVNMQGDLLASAEKNSNEMNVNIVKDKLDMDGSHNQVVSSVPKIWICIDKINLGSVIQYVFQSDLSCLNKFDPDHVFHVFHLDIGNGEQIATFIPVEKWVDGKSLQTYTLLLGKNSYEIFLLVYFM